MSSLSFRTKLLLAMMFIVGLVTVATLVATQHKVEDTYDRLFQDQFEAQVSAFSAAKWTPESSTALIAGWAACT